MANNWREIIKSDFAANAHIGFCDDCGETAVLQDPDYDHGGERYRDCSHYRCLRCGTNSSADSSVWIDHDHDMDGCSCPRSHASWVVTFGLTLTP